MAQNKDGDDMNAFDDVAYPLALGLDAKVSPEFSTSVMVTASALNIATACGRTRGCALTWGRAYVRTVIWAR
jgi:hypothetical protein